MRISDWSSDVCSSDLFRDTRKSRAIALIALPPAYSRRIRTTVSKTNIPISPPDYPGRCLNHRNEGSLLDADHPANGVLFARRSTVVTPQNAPARRLLKFRRGYCEELAYNALRSEEHTSELQSLMRNSYAVFFLKT